MCFSFPVKGTYGGKKGSRNKGDELGNLNEGGEMGNLNEGGKMKKP